jgi:FixJ family two-component response regulator
MLDPDSLRRDHRQKIFLIEDEPELRRSLQLLFEGRGFAVRAFGSPKALLADPALLESDCLIADYRMPELDGLQLMSELKERGWSAPAVLITAYPSADLTEQALERGYSEVATKPFLDRSIVGIVKRLLAV